MQKKNKKRMKISTLIIIIFAIIIGYYWINNSVTEVKLATIDKIIVESDIKFKGEIVPKNVELLHKKVRMKIKKVLAVPGTKVKKGDVLITYYGVTKDGYNEMLDSEVREQLNEKIILLDTLKKQLIEFQAQAQVLKKQLEFAKKTEAVMKELLDVNRATNSEVVAASTRVMLTNLDYQKVNREIEILKRTISLKSIVIEKELIERGTQTVAPEDGIIVKVIAKNGDNVIPAETLVVFAKNDSGLEGRFEIPEARINGVDIGDKVKVTKNNSKINANPNDKLVETSGIIYKLSDIETSLEVNGQTFRGLIGSVTLDEQDNFKMNDQITIATVDSSYEYGSGISTFSVLDASEEEKKGYVFIVEDGKAKKVEVQLGRKTNHKYEILNLSIGTEVVGNPYNLKEGEEVKITK